jgi:hypothetical protein
MTAAAALVKKRTTSSSNKRRASPMFSSYLNYLFINVQHVYKTHGTFITNKKECGVFISYYFLIAVKLKSDYEILILSGIGFCCRSRWSRDLRHERHERSLPARTLGPCFRIPLEAWMSVCVYSVCGVLC